MNEKTDIHVAVLAKDSKDFLSWKNVNNLVLDKIIGNRTYHMISNICGTCGLSFDEVVETDNANLNEDYNEIKTVLAVNLKIEK